MKRYIFTLTIAFMLTGNALAQTLAFDDIGMKYGYKNSNGIWQIPPRYQVAFAFQHQERKFAVVKYDGRWGCIDESGNMIVRNIFRTQEEAQEAGDQWYTAEEPGKPQPVGYCELPWPLGRPASICHDSPVPR